MSEVRPIDANALKEAFKEECCGCCENCSHCMTGLNCELIDNAPTVEPENLIKPIAEIKCEISEEEKQRIIELLRKEKPKFVKLEPEITDEDIQNAIKQGYNDGYAMAKAKYERPKGKWIEKQETPASVSYYCSNCECAGLGVENFCSWCGADMRKENNDDM